MSIASAPVSLARGLPAVVFSRGAVWLCSLAVSLLFLLAPALWNGFAIVFHDTGGYIDRIIQMNLGYGRSFFYGLFLWFASLGWWSFWGPVTAQALACLWLIRLMLRCHGLPAGPVTTAACVVLLSCFTGISWYAGQLLPDILVPLTVLGLWLLGFRWPDLSRAERLLLAAIALLGMLSHMSCLALGMGLALVAVLAKTAGTWWRPQLPVHVLPPLATVMTALILMPLVHFMLVGQAGYTPGGPVFIFARFVQDGIARKYLAAHCPIEGVRLCGLQDRLGGTADEFLWGDSAFKDLGDWQGAKAELGYLVRECVITYPAEVIWSSLVLTAQQMVMVGTGDGLAEHHFHARGVFASLSRAVNGQYLAARQQQEQLTRSLFDGLNRVHVPVALLSMLGLVPVILWGVLTKQAEFAALGTFTLLSLFGNAFICGALSNPHDRYQSRLVWIATLIVIMAVLRRQQPGGGENRP